VVGTGVPRLLSPLLVPPQLSRKLPIQLLNYTNSLETTMASTKAYPPGGTFLDTVKKSFTDVPVDNEKDNAVSTTEFLEATESLTTLFGMRCILPTAEAGTDNGSRCSGINGVPASQERHVGQCEGAQLSTPLHLPPENPAHRPQKIRDRQLTAPLESTTIQELVINELKTKKHTATEGLVWLVRFVPPPSLYPPQKLLGIN
jgi:hypothetical protein